jgi:hypothetical protein
LSAFYRGIVRLGLSKLKFNDNPTRLLSILDFDNINDMDFRAWLRLNGAGDDSVNGALMRSVYWMFMSDTLAAGEATKACLRVLKYRGDFLWHFVNGPGEDVFMPLYEVLHANGVKFHFFHKLKDVQLADDGVDAIQSMKFSIQENTKEGREYDPLDRRTRGVGLPFWPTRPDSKQIENTRYVKEYKYEDHNEEREVGTRDLKRGKDFDTVIVGIPFGVLREVGKSLFSKYEKRRYSDSKVKLVANHGFQIWMNTAARELGLAGPPMSVGAFNPGKETGVKADFDGWYDMRHRLPAEQWRVISGARGEGVIPRSLFSFRGRVDIGQRGQAPTNAGAEIERIKEYLNSYAKLFWPDAVDSKGNFREALLATEAWNTSVRYHSGADLAHQSVQATPDSFRLRISPEDHEVSNLRVCGDWTASGLGWPTAESAVLSGRQAAKSVLDSG